MVLCWLYGSDRSTEMSARRTALTRYAFSLPMVDLNSKETVQENTL